MPSTKPRSRAARLGASPRPLRVGSLCTGYGGLEMALEMAGLTTELVWVADDDRAASAVLAARHPNVPNLSDIKAIDFTAQPEIDLLTAGYPCQPFSLAGLKKGDKDERHLWPYVFDAVRVLRPGFVLLENVPGHRSRGFGRVLADLASIGYVGSWVSLRASDIGAAHQRDRVFIHAHPADATGDPWRFLDGDVPAVGRHGRPEQLTLFPTPHANCATGPGQQGRDGGMNIQTAVATLLPTPTAVDGNRALAHYPDQYTTLPDAVAQLLPTPTATRYGNNQSPTPGAAVRPGLDSITRLLPTPRATDGTNGGPNQRGSKGDIALPAAVQPERWGRYAAAITRWEHVLGRPAPSPTEPGRNGPRLAPPFVEWLIGLPEGWVCDVAGLSRNDILRILGNGVVPQQGAAAARILNVNGVPS